MPSLVQGRIVWCDTFDQEGRNPKIRPIVIMDPDPAAIPPEGHLHGVCVTTQIGFSPRDECVALPYRNSPTQKVLTKLTEQCEAVCTWQVSFVRAEIKGYLGLVPAQQLRQIQAKLEEIKAREA